MLENNSVASDALRDDVCPRHPDKMSASFLHFRLEATASAPAVSELVEYHLALIKF